MKMIPGYPFEPTLSTPRPVAPLPAATVKLIKRIVSVLLLLAVALVLIYGPRTDVLPVKDRVVAQYWEKTPC